MVLSNLAYTLLGAIDTLFLGRVSTMALGAVGLGGLLFLTASLLLRGSINGTIPYVSRMYGAGNKLEAGRYLQYFLCLSALLSPIVLVLPFVFRGYFALLRPDPQVANLALVYISIRLIELPFSLIVTALNGFMIGIGNTKLPMILAWIAVSINIGANYVLIFGHLGFPALGVAGAAWATVLAVFIQAIITAIIVFRKYGHEYAINKWNFPTPSILKNMAKIGFPMGMTDAIEVGAFTTFFALISRLGTAELAASQIANQIAAVAFMPGFAMSAATGSLVGRYMGGKQLAVAEKVGYIGAFLGAFSMGILGVGFWIFADFLGRAFTSDLAVLALTGALLRLMAFYQLFDGFNIVFRGALNGAGDTKFTMIVTTIGAWALFIPAVYVFTFILQWNLTGAWMGAIAYLITLGIVFSTRFRAGKWKTIEL